jgi:hypothetical protein
LEAGAATFIGMYLASLALVLALHNRGFTEIGVRGVKAQGLTGKADQRGFVKAESAIARMEKAIERLERGEAD